VTTIAKIKSWAEPLLQLFYPRLCEGCSQSLIRQEKVLCISCTSELPLTDYHNNPNNDTVSRFAGRLKFEHATSLAYFTSEGLLQHLLHQLKYNDKPEVGTYLGQQLGYGLQQTEWITVIDTIIPVPLHKKKEITRGYNQSMAIAEGLNDILSIPVDDTSLYRLRHTESQTKKSRAERAENMQEVFGTRNIAALENKHVLIVDDVLTTGATLEACALALQKIPGLKVSFATIGIAVD
jgi:ComF family protein